MELVGRDRWARRAQPTGHRKLPPEGWDSTFQIGTVLSRGSGLRPRFPSHFPRLALSSAGFSQPKGGRGRCCSPGFSHFPGCRRGDFL